MVCYQLPHTTLYKMRGNAVTQRFFHWATPPHYNWLDYNLMVHHTRLLGVIIYHKLTWSKHLSDLKRNFSKKLNLLKKCSFLKRRALLDLYFKAILPSVTYGIIVWGGEVATTLTTYKHLKHCIAAARIIFNLSWDTPSDTVMEITKWD